MEYIYYFFWYFLFSLKKGSTGYRAPFPSFVPRYDGYTQKKYSATTPSISSISNISVSDQYHVTKTKLFTTQLSHLLYVIAAAPAAAAAGRD